MLMVAEDKAIIKAYCPLNIDGNIETSHGCELGFLKIVRKHNAACRKNLIQEPPKESDHNW